MPTAGMVDGEIHYQVFGDGEPLLLVPGLGGLGSYWLPNIEALSKEFRVVIHDHLGTGKSSRSEITYTVDQMTSDLVRVMDHLGIEAAHLVGHSTGGAIGQTLAATQPERLKSLVLYSTWTKADPFFRRVFEARRNLLTEAGTRAYIRSTPIFLYPDWWINANSDVLEAREEAAEKTFPNAAIVASRIDAIVNFDRTTHLATVSTPVLVLCANDDILTPPYFSRELAERIPNARLKLLDKGGHCSSETMVDTFNEAVLSFLGHMRS